MISAKYTELFIRLQKLPSYEAVARELEINVSTVKRHVQEMDFEERFRSFRCMSGMVLNNVLKQAATGKNDKFAKMWLELFEGLGAKKKLEVTGADGQPLFKVYKGIDTDKV